MSEHAPVSPSGLARVIQCSGSLLACQNIVETGDNFPADEGTTAHWGASEVLTDGFSVGEMVGSTCIDTGMKFTAEMVPHVQMYVDYCLGMGFIEKKVKIPAIHPDCWGTLDAGGYEPVTNTLTIVDFKYGWLPHMPHCPQLVAYADGLGSELGLPMSTTVKLVIVQPRPFHRFGPIREFVTDLGSIRREALEIGVRVSDAYLRPTLTTGPSCKYCPRIGDCPAFARASLNAIDFSMLPDFDSVEYRPENRAAMLTALHRSKDLIALRIAEEEEKAMSLIKSGVAIPGYEVYHSPGRMGWKNKNDLIKFGELMGVDLRADLPCSPTEAKTRGFTDAQINSMTTRPGGKATLTKISLEHAKHVFQ